MVIGGRGVVIGGRGCGYVNSHCTGDISHVQPLLSICRCASKSPW